MINIQITNTNTTAFMYLWMKTVKNFDPSVHCAKCLVGPYEKEFGLKMPAEINISREEGEILYFCGVTKPYRWENNLHLAGKVTDGASSEISLHNGGTLRVVNLSQISILPDKAKELYPEKSAKFLTCRNFQFGAQIFN